MNKQEYKSPLHKTVCTTCTDIWNDSCSVEELTYAIENGAVGAITNPVIVGEVLKKEMHLWKDRILEIIKEMPEGTEEDIAWKLNEDMTIKGAELLMPVFEREKGLKGRISIQTNAKYYRNARLIHMHWSEFIGADMVLTIPYGWQKKFNASDIEVVERIDNPVDPVILNELLNKFEDFRRAYYEDGMTPEEFDFYGATARTLRSFIQGYEGLLGVIRDLMLPDPDKG